MRFWQALSFTEPEHVVPVAQIAEAVGFHGAFVSDHMFAPEKIASRYPYSADGNPPFTSATPWPDPFVTASAILATTTRLQVSTGVYILPLRNPFEVAKATGTLALLSGGRFALGAGLGWMQEEFALCGHDFASRGRRFDEMVAVMRSLWRGGMVEHHGAFYDFPRLEMSPPAPAAVPVYVGGGSDVALRRAGRLGDGWIGAGNAPEQLPAILEAIGKARREHGREKLPFETIVALTVPPDAEVVRRAEDLGVSGIVSWPLSYQIGPGASLAAKRAHLERYADDVIAKLG